MWIINKIVSLFNNFFKLFKIIDENKQLNIITAISKDKDGYILLEISPIHCNKSTYTLYPHQVVQNNLLKSLFRKKDQRIIEAILVTEGDLFITAKEYENNVELYTLESLITRECNKLSLEDIRNNLEILHRTNKRYFDFNNSIKLDMSFRQS